MPTAHCPAADEVNRLRSAVMLHTHIMPFIAVLAVFWARGWLSGHRAPPDARKIAPLCFFSQTAIARSPGWRAETLSPGAGARAAFENPKVAAHGDYACTAAMQLAKPLKLNPRALGEQLKAALEATARLSAVGGCH